MKVIQNALLYNKIECYNKGVQRSSSLSNVALTPWSFSPFQVQDVRKGAKDGLSTVMTFGGWLRHHAWREHRKSPLLTKNNGVSWGRKAAEPSDSTWPTDVGYDPSLMNISTTRKSSNEHGAFIDATSGVSEGRI